MLTWQDNAPRFVAKGFTGDQMILYFGSTFIDDIEISEFHLEIQLLEYDGKWSINTPWTQLSEGSREFPAHTDKFLFELKLASKENGSLSLANIGVIGIRSMQISLL